MSERFTQLVPDYSKKFENLKDSQEYFDEFGLYFDLFIRKLQRKYQEAQEAYGKKDFKEKFEEIGKIINSVKPPLDND